MTDNKPSGAVAAEPCAMTRVKDTACAARSAQRRASVCISSDALFGGATEVQIEHRGALYRLQQTSLGKLILIK